MLQILKLWNLYTFQIIWLPVHNIINHAHLTINDTIWRLLRSHHTLGSSAYCLINVRSSRWISCLYVEVWWRCIIFASGSDHIDRCAFTVKCVERKTKITMQKNENRTSLFILQLFLHFRCAPFCIKITHKWPPYRRPITVKCDASYLKVSYTLLRWMSCLYVEVWWRCIIFASEGCHIDRCALTGKCDKRATKINM